VGRHLLLQAKPAISTAGAEGAGEAKPAIAVNDNSKFPSATIKMTHS